MANRNWNAGIWLTTLLCVSGFEGCRFGNHVEPSEESTTEVGLDGYYGIAPQALDFCADHGTTQCASAAVNLLPETLASVFTNPVILVQDAEDPAAAWFVSNDENQYSLPTAVSDDDRIAYSGSTTPEMAWDDPACTSTLYIDELGSRETTDAGAQAASGEPLSGRISLTVSVIRTFEGECAASLNSIQSCYLDSSACGGSSDSENLSYQSQLQALFQPYIESGTMTADDISSLHSIAYEATYE